MRTFIFLYLISIYLPSSATGNDKSSNLPSSVIDSPSYEKQKKLKKKVTPLPILKKDANGVLPPPAPLVPPSDQEFKAVGIDPDQLRARIKEDARKRDEAAADYDRRIKSQSQNNS